MNRAFDGDVVAVEMLPEGHWEAPSSKLPSSRASSKAADADAADREVAAEIAPVCVRS